MKRSSFTRPSRVSLAVTCATLTAVPLWAGGGTSGWTERVSFAANGAQLAFDADSPQVSADGSVVAFATRDALVPEDTNDAFDVYIFERATGVITCASVDVYGDAGNGDSAAPALSANGRYVAFQSGADNLGGIDQNFATDVYVRDLLNGTTRIASGANGSVFAAHGSSYSAAISASGRYVAFQSSADDFVPGDTNFNYDIYIHDLDTGTLTRASMGFAGEPTQHCGDPSISADGQRVVFDSSAPNLVPGDGNGTTDVFLFDAALGSLQAVSRNPGGTTASGSSYAARISADGERVVFVSTADDVDPRDSNGVGDVYLARLDFGSLELVSLTPTGQAGNGVSRSPSISSDGQYAAFLSFATDLLPDSPPHQAVYLRELASGRTWQADRPDGALLTSGSAAYFTSVSNGGRFVAFTTSGAGLDATDTNGVRDVYLRTTIEDPEVYCVANATSGGCVPSITSVGFPSERDGVEFLIRAGQMPVNRAAMLFYGFNGRDAQPFLGGTLCVDGSLRRTPIRVTTALGAGPCDGFLTFDMGAFASGAEGGSPSLRLSMAGTTVNAQFWGRDQGNVLHGVFLTEAIEFVVGP